MVMTFCHSSGSCPRSTSRSARRRVPNRSRISVAFGKLVLRRRPSAFFEELDERLQQLLVLVDAGLD